MRRPIKTLLFSTLFPSSVRPVHGIFVETRLRELLKTGEVETKVVAPVPWFPFSGKRFGEYGQFAATSGFEHRNSIDVFHPRYFLPPKVGMNVAPQALAAGAMPTIRKLMQDGFNFDLIDAHYYYPDGVAAGIIAKKLGKPFVVTARGTDLNLIPQYPYPRQLILKTAAEAFASIGVCKALMDSLAELGAEQTKLHVFRNGVDLERFQPEGQAFARKKLSLPDRKILLSVGHLVELKGHHIAIEALTKLPANVFLIIAGSGPERTSLEELTQKLGVTAQVLFTGQLKNSELRSWYSAADALVLCSSREGWANVLLESMACGTPVVATSIPGTCEVVCSPQAGMLANQRTPECLAATIASLLSNPPSRQAVRNHAEDYSWEDTTRKQLKLFDKAIVAATASPPHSLETRRSTNA
jgi:teichuronic acid biosynthesis glycosyltransferase TuaC